MRLLDAELRHKAAEQLRVVFEARLRQHDLVAFAVLRHVVKDDAEFLRERTRIHLEIAFGAGTRPGAVNADERVPGAHLLIMETNAFDRDEFAFELHEPHHADTFKYYALRSCLAQASDLRAGSRASIDNRINELSTSHGKIRRK